MMGTTTTPNLGLIKPDTDESIKPNGPMVGWAAQNTLNCNAIDTVFRNQSNTWVPSWTATTVNPTLGAGGSVNGKYLRLWPKLVIAYVRIFTGGAGFNAGTGTYRLNMPFAISPILDAANFPELPLGKAILRDNTDVAVSEAAVVVYDPTADNLFIRTESGTSAWTNTAPFALDQSDRMSCYFIYPTDAA